MQAAQIEENQTQHYYLFPAFLQKPTIQIIVLAVIAFFCYANSILNEYAVDDTMVILDNEYTKKGFKGIKKILTEDSFAGSQGGLRILAGGRYRPLSLVTFAVEYQFFGQKPLPSHFVNVVLFVLSIVVLYQLLRRFIFPKIPEAAFIATLIFAIHPIHTEAVANIKGRDEILSFLFLCLTIDYGFRSYFNKTTQNLVLFSLFYFLALLSKENGLVLLGLFPVTLWVFTDAQGRAGMNKIINSSLPIVGVLIVYFLIRFALTDLPTEGVKDVLNNTFAEATLEQKYATIVVVFSYYLKLMLFPHPLSWDYAYKQIPYHDFSDLVVWASLLLNLGLLLFGIWGSWKKNIWGYALLFYFTSLVLVSNIFVNIGGVLGERFLYQASLGLALLVGYGVVWLAQQKKVPPSALMACLAVIVLAGGGKTMLRNLDWKNNFTLFTKDVSACPNSTVANRACGSAYLNKAAAEPKDGPEKQALIRAGLPYLHQALKIYPKFFEAFLDLGSGYYMAHQLDSAEYYWDKARKINSLHPLLIENDKLMSNSFGLKGYNAGRANQLDSAVYYLEKSIRYQVENAAAWNTLGIVRGIQKDYPESIKCLKKAIEYSPTTGNYYADLGISYLQAGERQAAITAFEKALQLDPNLQNAKLQLEALKKLNP